MVRSKSIVVAVPAAHPPVLRLRAAARATAIAEYYRARGKKVLLLIDSLTRCAHAQREIGLVLGEPQAMKGYPLSALSLIPRLVERAGVDCRSGGSITALYTVLADGDATDDPIVAAAREIGRASCRERWCPYVWISVFAASLNKKPITTNAKRP